MGATEEVEMGPAQGQTEPLLRSPAQPHQVGALQTLLQLHDHPSINPPLLARNRGDCYPTEQAQTVEFLLGPVDRRLGIGRSFFETGDAQGSLHDRRSGLGQTRDHDAPKSYEGTRVN